VTRTVRLPVTDNGHVVAVLAVVAAPPTMSTAGKLRLVSKADDVVQPDTTSARSVRVAQRTAAISTHVPYVQQLDILGYKRGNPTMPAGARYVRVYCRHVTIIGSAHL